MQNTVNVWVGGSNPSQSAKKFFKINGLWGCGRRGCPPVTGKFRWIRPPYRPLKNVVKGEELRKDVY